MPKVQPLKLIPTPVLLHINKLQNILYNLLPSKAKSVLHD
jgi:hypothetical protein